jgi:hypothetical protein
MVFRLFRAASDLISGPTPDVSSLRSNTASVVVEGARRVDGLSMRRSSESNRSSLPYPVD